MSREMDVYRARPARLSWKVPVFCNNDWAAVKLLRACEQLGFDRPFDTVYGSPLCAWTSGRPSAIRQQLSERELHRYFQAYASFGVKVALTWSRLQVDPATFDDAYCRLLLKVASQYGAQAILVDDSLAEFIRDAYPDMVLVSSVNKAMCELKDDYSVEVDYYRALLERYDRVVVRSEFVIDKGKAQALGNMGDRLEYIANLVCVRDCQFCHDHVTSIEAQDDSPNQSKAHGCFYRRDASRLDTWMDINLNVCESRICELAEMGYTYAKLAGRNAALPTLLSTFGKYIFEPTGAYAGIEQSILAEYRALSERVGTNLPPHMLPFA